MVTRKRRARKSCKNGKLKKPVRTKKGGKRRCKKKRKSKRKSKSKKKHRMISYSKDKENKYLIIGDIESCKNKTSPLFCNWEFYEYLNNRLKGDKNLKLIFLGDYFDKGTEDHMKVVVEGICNLIIAHNNIHEFPEEDDMTKLIKFMYKQAKLCHVEDIKQTWGDRVIIIFGNRDINKLRMIYEQSDFSNINNVINDINKFLTSSDFLVDKVNNVENTTMNQKTNLFVSHAMVSGISKKDSFEKFGISNSVNINKFVDDINIRFQKYIDEVMNDWGDSDQVSPNVDYTNKSLWEGLTTKIPKPWVKGLNNTIKSTDNKLYTWFQNSMGLNPVKGNDPGSSYLLKYFCPKKSKLVPPDDHGFFQVLALGDNFVTSDDSKTTPSMVTSSIAGCNTPQNLNDHINLEGFCNKHGIKALISGHKPVCFPVPLFYNHDKTTFILSDLTQDNVLKIKGGDYITPVGVYNPHYNTMKFDFLMSGYATNADSSQKPITTAYGKLNQVTLSNLNDYYNKPFSIEDDGVLISRRNHNNFMSIIPGKGSRDKRQAMLN